MCENDLAQLKRCLRGTHIRVDPKRLHRYLDEFDYRFSTCYPDDIEPLSDLGNSAQ